MNIDKRALKGVVDEIEASRARQKGETEFQREALKRAVKNHQLDAKAIRIVLQRRAMGDTKRDEQDYYVHSYEVALGGKKDALDALEQGASIRQAAKAGGISTGAAAALAKGVQESSFVNRETGEITETAVLDTPPGGSSERADNEAASGAALTKPFCRECEGTGVIVYDDGAKIHGSEPCPVCRGSYVAPPTAPHPDERADTATQQETPALCSCEKCVDSRIHQMRAAGAPYEHTVPGPGLPGWSYGCALCGNKRCPHHTDHRLACTNSNEPGQPGSSYPAWTEQPVEIGAVGSLQGDRVASPSGLDSDGVLKALRTTNHNESDGLEIPTFLRREKVRA